MSCRGNSIDSEMKEFNSSTPNMSSCVGHNLGTSSAVAFGFYLDGLFLVSLGIWRRCYLNVLKIIRCMKKVFICLSWMTLVTLFVLKMSIMTGATSAAGHLLWITWDLFIYGSLFVLLSPLVFCVNIVFCECVCLVVVFQVLNVRYYLLPCVFLNYKFQILFKRACLRKDCVLVFFLTCIYQLW